MKLSMAIDQIATNIPEAFTGHHLSYMPPGSSHPEINKISGFTPFLQAKRCSGSRAEQTGALFPSVISPVLLAVGCSWSMCQPSSPMASPQNYPSKPGLTYGLPSKGDLYRTAVMKYSFDMAKQLKKDQGKVGRGRREKTR